MNNSIAILGGMGPTASAHMLDRIIALAGENFGAKNADEFPEILLLSIPIPDFLSNTTNRTKALEILKNRIASLNQHRPLVFAIACNTAHCFLPDLQETSRSKIISMIEEVSDTVKLTNLKKVGLLASPTTLKIGLYQKSLKNSDIDLIFPSQRQINQLDKIIRNVIAGKILKSDIKLLLSMSRSLEKKGAQGLILGCTELPLVFPVKFNLPIFNSVDITANALLRKYYTSNTIGFNHSSLRSAQRRTREVSIIKI